MTALAWEKVKKLGETMSDILISPNGKNNDKELSILLAQQTFVDMVLNFLGTKEKLNYRTDNDFILRLNDIEQFHYLLEAKIAKEQTVHINHFSVAISYHDGTSREINDIRALNGFIETRDVLPRSVTLTWNVVVDFPTSTSVENQTIELTFSTNRKAEKLGEVILTINHTNQAWGKDTKKQSAILNLVKNREELLQKHLDEENKKIITRLEFLGSVFAIWIAFYLYLNYSIKYFKTQSHILINNRSEKQYNSEREKQSKTEYYSITSVCVAIIIGVIGNFVYQLLTQ